LDRSVSLFEATLYGVGIILGAGIYALIGEAAGIAGNALWLSFIFSGVIAAFTALSYAELSSMFPKASAEFLYVRKAFNREWLAFFIAWITIVTGFISVAAVALGFAGYFSAYLSIVPMVFVALGIIALLSFINFLGIKTSVRLNVILTIVEAAGLVIIILIGLPFLGSVDYFATPSGAVSLSNFSPIAVTTALIFFAFIGFESLANITEETRQAAKTIPKAVLLSLAISTIIYILVALSVVSIVPWQELAESTAPLALVAERALSSQAGMALAVMALFSTANTVLIILIGVSRRFYGISKEQCLPNFLQKIHPKTHTPYYAIIATMLLAMFLAGIQLIDVLAFLTDFGVFIIFLVVNLAVIFLRFNSPEIERPFRIPLNLGRLPLLPLLGVLTCAYMLFITAGHITATSPCWIVGLGTVLFLVSIPFYFFFRGRFQTAGKQARP